MIKRIFTVILAFTPIFMSGQGAAKSEIDWLPLKKAKKYSKKYNRNILIFFYKKNCEYCDKMKTETLNQKEVINLINNNFLPVKIDSRIKDTIYYKGKKYSNQQPVEHGYTFRHDFYAEVASFTRNNKAQSTTPTIVLFNNKFEKIKVLPGIQPKQLLLRNLKPFILK